MLANVKDADGYTALHYASIKGHVRATEDLLSFGAQLAMKSNTKETVLHFAARCVRPPPATRGPPFRALRSRSSSKLPQSPTLYCTIA